MQRPIIIAADGSSGSLGALRIGLALAEQSAREVRVLTVFESFAALGGRIGLLPRGYAPDESQQAEELRAAVARQVAELGAGAGVPVSVSVGSAARTIIRRAFEERAGLIVMGSGPRAPLERWMRSDVAATVSRLATVPVLVVPESTRALPSRVLVAVDFSRFSLRAARAVVEIVREHGHIFLAHLVNPLAGSEPQTNVAEWTATYTRGAEARLEQLAQEIRARTSATVTTCVYQAQPAHDLVKLAERLNVDLVAAGTHGFGYFGRLVFGSVASRLLRGWSGMVLLAPPATCAPEILREEGHVRPPRPRRSPARAPSFTPGASGSRA